MSLSLGVSEPLTLLCAHIHTTGCSCVSLVINGSDVAFSRCKQTFNITICAHTHYSHASLHSLSIEAMSLSLGVSEPLTLLYMHIHTTAVYHSASYQWRRCRFL